MFRATLLFLVLSFSLSNIFATARTTGSNFPTPTEINKVCYSYLNDANHLFRAPGGKHEVVVAKNGQPIKTYGPLYGEREMAGKMCNFNENPKVTFDQIVYDRIKEELEQQLAIFNASPNGSEEREAARATGHAIIKACKNTTGSIVKAAVKKAFDENPHFEANFNDAPPTTESLSGFGSSSPRSVLGD
ncbi:MAG: hypothetical protein HOE90_23375 [Bacteriovoracaceae bacterium]|jgi:hypothetical protein|nr:hypothetical protein [Bacteriovoracaceae bacterium]